MANRPTSSDRNELKARIRQAWDEIEAIVRPLDERRLAAIPPDGGWSVKDHLAHMAVWLEVAAARVRGMPDNAPFGMDEMSFIAADIDGLNEAAHRLNRDRAPEDVLSDLRETHAGMLEIVEGLAEADLAGPARSLRPRARQEPLITTIAANTYEHYEEHAGWIRALLARLD